MIAALAMTALIRRIINGRRQAFLMAPGITMQQADHYRPWIRAFS
jgi:hypothetical protein